MEYKTLIYETRDNYALISLNRPQRLNAWTWKMAREQLHAIAAANADAEVGAIVMTGVGRAFFRVLILAMCSVNHWTERVPNTRQRRR